MFWAPWHQSMSTYSKPSFSSSTWNSVIFVNENENENGEKWENNEFVNEN